MANASSRLPDYAVALRAVRVVRRAGVRTKGWLIAGMVHIPVALGRSGIRAGKRGGGGGTPGGGVPAREGVGGCRGGIAAPPLPPGPAGRPAPTGGGNPRPPAAIPAGFGWPTARAATASGGRTTSTT